MGEARKFCADARAKFEEGSDITTLLILPSEPEIIGCASLLSRDADVPSFELTYWLHIGFVGRGYVTEAAQGLTTFAVDRLGSRRGEIHIDGNNH